MSRPPAPALIVLGTGSDVGTAVSFGIASLSSGDVIEAWYTSGTSSDTITPVDMSLIAVKIG